MTATDGEQSHNSDAFVRKWYSWSNITREPCSFHLLWPDKISSYSVGVCWSKSRLVQWISVKLEPAAREIMASLTPSLTDTGAIKDMDDCPRHAPGDASCFARYGGESRPEEESSGHLKTSDIRRRRAPNVDDRCQRSWREGWDVEMWLLYLVTRRNPAVWFLWVLTFTRTPTDTNQRPKHRWRTEYTSPWQQELRDDANEASECSCSCVFHTWRCVGIHRGLDHQRPPLRRHRHGHLPLFVLGEGCLHRLSVHICRHTQGQVQLWQPESDDLCFNKTESTAESFYTLCQCWQIWSCRQRESDRRPLISEEEECFPPEHLCEIENHRVCIWLWD